MPLKRGWVVWLALAALAAPLVLPTGRAEGSLVIFAGYEEGALPPGAQFNFTLHVFHNGAPVTPPEPPGVMVLDEQNMTIHYVPVSETGLGRYAGRYTVLAADAGASGSVRLVAEAAYPADSGTGGQTARAWMEVRVDTGLAESVPVVTARLADFSDSPVLPGTRLAFECCATLDGIPFDPAGLAFRMRHSVSWPGDNVSISPLRIGPGSYIARYTVPKQNQSDRFFLDARWYGSAGDRFTGAEVGLDLYQVVYHELGRTGTRVDYELWVFDRGGAPVNASSVRLSIAPGGPGQGTGTAGGAAIDIDIGKTDASGRVRSLIDLGGAGDEAHIRGWANTSRFCQRFCATVALFGGQDGYVPPPASGFQVVRANMEGVALPGSMVKIDYVAYMDGRPLGDVPVDCYMRLARTGPPGPAVVSVTGQRLHSDDNGRFALNISFPSGHASVAMATFVGPAGVTGARQSDSDELVAVIADEQGGGWWVNATLSRAEPGRALGVSVRGTGLACAIAGWLIDHGPSGSEQRQWSAWTSMEWPLKRSKGGGPPFKGGVVIPSCIRAGTNITVLLRLANSSGEMSEASLPARVKSVSGPPAGNDLCCLAVAAVVNIALFGYVLYQYNAAKKAPRAETFGDRPVDERIGDILNAPGGAPARDPALPFKADLVQSVDCAVCGRRIARGNMAWGCACGRKFHEHCLKKEAKCAYCGREWSWR